MNKNRYILLLPLCLLGLVSCMPDSQPKNLSYDEAINYIKNNSKGEKTPIEGWLHYNCSDLTTYQGMLIYLGADNPVVKTGDRKQLESTVIDGYIGESKEENVPTTLTNTTLPLMYLTVNNFKTFVSDYSSYFTFQLTYVKEFIVTFKDINENSYVRHYNKELNLTRFELHEANNVYDITQAYYYN